MEQRGFEPPAPIRLKMPASKRSFSRNPGEYQPSENWFTINSLKGGDTVVDTIPTKMAATGFVARTERTWTSKSEDRPWNNQAPRREPKKPL